MTGVGDFLTARIQEDERQADGDARLLREAGAKRKILARHVHTVTRHRVLETVGDGHYAYMDEPEVTCDICGWVAGELGRACPDLSALAGIYSDHPDAAALWDQEAS